MVLVGNFRLYTQHSTLLSMTVRHSYIFKSLSVRRVMSNVLYCITPTNFTLPLTRAVALMHRK